MSRVAIVGENGAGKSTLIKLLLRFYRPTSGRILVGGHDLQDVAIESWYAQLATLLQDFNRYPLSIAENIQIGKPRAPDKSERLASAARASNVDSFVRQYQHGWDTMLNATFQNGVEPSGGQWQRVALARAFYRHAHILILDEPTAAVDANAESAIFNSILEQYRGKSAIMVSHRFSTVRAGRPHHRGGTGRDQRTGQSRGADGQPRPLLRDVHPAGRAVPQPRRRRRAVASPEREGLPAAAGRPLYARAGLSRQAGFAL